MQRLPALLSYVQGMVDQDKRRGRFILTGSHQPQLHEVISQSLAGRTVLLTLWPFSLPELRHYEPVQNPYDIIYRGCFPRLYEEGLETRRFFNSYLQTPDFLKGLERFQALEIKRGAAGAVLYNGERRFTVRDVCIFNPLHVEDIWETLNTPLEQGRA